MLYIQSSDFYFDVNRYRRKFMVILMLFLTRCVKFYSSMVSYKVLFLSYLASCQYGATPNISILSMQSGVYNSVIITVLCYFSLSLRAG